MKTQKFDSIVDLVVARSPLQKKKLRAYLARRDASFMEEAESFANDYCGYLESQKIPLEFAVSAYLEMCAMMMRCQIEFMKTGSYTIQEHSQAFEETYSNKEKMTSYMIGLAISQFLWETHYEILKSFERATETYCPTVDSYLEIGPGHGLYLHKAMKLLKPHTRIKVIDISPVSIAITKSIMAHFHPQRASISYCTDDVLKHDTEERFGFVVMGEVLEHINVPQRVLVKLNKLLEVDGRAFVSTAINSPAVDHVYHYKSVDDVRVMIRNAGLEIENELVLPVEDLPMEEIVEKKITINYCAVLKKETGHE
ncbi:MAG: methyltransferase domain-containing protein [Ignavibacteriales bacterium]|nr:methyltransferase domain-containing protein [Ignavibacteriales bacterium]